MLQHLKTFWWSSAFRHWTVLCAFLYHAASGLVSASAPDAKPIFTYHASATCEWRADGRLNIIDQLEGELLNEQSPLYIYDP